MIKEALEYLISLGNVKREKVGSQEYSTQQLHLIEEPTAETIQVQTLTGLIDYINSNFDHIFSVSDTDDSDNEKSGSRLLVHVVGAKTVNVFSQFNRDKQRNFLLQANADLPEFSFGHFYDIESFNIALQSAFIDGLDRPAVLKVVGNIKEEQVKNTGDDGVSQVVTARTGIAEVGLMGVPNPVALRPYRTFTEVKQPQSDFVFRLQNGPRAALFEADGGAWTHEAVQSIKDFIESEIKEEYQDKVVVIA